jgi:transducin (beta)-like 1
MPVVFLAHGRGARWSLIDLVILFATAGTCCLDVEWLGPKHYATCGTDRKIYIYSTTNTGESLASLTGHSDEVNQLRLSPDGTILASVSDDKTTRLWDVCTWAVEEGNTEVKGRASTIVNKLEGGHEKHVSMVQWLPTQHEGAYNILATYVVF